MYFVSTRFCGAKRAKPGGEGKTAWNRHHPTCSKTGVEIGAGSGVHGGLV